MIIKLNDKICKNKNEAIDLIKEGKGFNLSIALDNGDEYEIKYREIIYYTKDGNLIIDGSVCWYKNGMIHRDDGPAVEYVDGTKFWYKNSMVHRDDGPAVEYTNGTKYWYKNSRIHREDGPAIEFANGPKFYYLNGLIQNDN